MNKELIKHFLKEIAVERARDAITKDEAFSTGCSVCGSQAKDDCGHGHEFEKEAELYVEDPSILSDWVGIRRHSMAPCESSYRKAGDMLVMNPEILSNIIQPILDATGATCPVSTAKAAADILELLGQKDI